METITKDDIVILSSSDLCPNIHGAIMSQLYKREGSCSKEGCIISITSLNKIYEAVIDPDGTINFSINYTYERFVPRVGLRCIATVTAVYPEGTIADVNSCVSAILLNKSINIGSRIEIVLKELSFRDKSFRCVAEC